MLALLILSTSAQLRQWYGWCTASPGCIYGYGMVDRACICGISILHLYCVLYW